jgi:uncharacterized protein (DUF2141 family)
MKTRLLIPALLIPAASWLAPLAQAGELTVTISDIRSNKGQLLVAVMSSDAAWNDQAKPVAVRKLPATESPMVLKLELPAGSYAVQVLHDENDNGKLDANLMGIPTEGYGFSNNPQVMRRAHFDEARFDISEAPAAITVRLR